MSMTVGLRDKLRPVVIASAQSICRNPLADGSPCRDCRYTMSVLGQNLINALADDVIHPWQLWCDEIRSAALDS